MREVLDHYMPQIERSDVLKRMGLTTSKFFIVSAHREENIDSKENMTDMVDTLNALANAYDCPVIVSTHPRTKKRLTDLGAELHPLIQEMKPFGFFDYVRLQQDSYCTISDSGTITEEAAIVGFPAVTARDTQERQEGMDSGVLVMTGIDSNSIIDGVNMARKHFDDQLSRNIPLSYQELDVSWRVAKLIQSYTGYVNRKTWHKNS